MTLYYLALLIDKNGLGIRMYSFVKNPYEYSNKQVNFVKNIETWQVFFQYLS